MALGEPSRAGVSFVRIYFSKQNSEETFKAFLLFKCSSYLLMLFFLSSSRRGDFSVCVQEWFRSPGRAALATGWLVWGQRGERAALSLSTASGSRSTHKKERSAVPPDVQSVKSTNSYPTLLRSFGVLSPANPPPSPRRRVRSHASRLL